MTRPALAAAFAKSRGLLGAAVLAARGGQVEHLGQVGREDLPCHVGGADAVRRDDVVGAGLCREGHQGVSTGSVDPGRSEVDGQSETLVGPDATADPVTCFEDRDIQTLLGEEAGGNIRALALVHATRVLVIVSLMPLLLTLFWGLELSGPPGEPAANVPPREFAVMLVCAVFGWWAATRLGLFGAPILGPLIVSGAASMTDLLHARPPAEVMQFAQFFLGLGIGVKYAGITGLELRRYVGASLGYCLLLAGLSVVFAEIVIQSDLADPLDAIIAFAPGGQAEMVLLAIIAGTDMAYVVTHHLVRIVVVIIGAPIVARLMRG